MGNDEWDGSILPPLFSQETEKRVIDNITSGEE